MENKKIKYAKKNIKGRKKRAKLSKQGKLIVISWLICLLIGCVIGSGLIVAAFAKHAKGTAPTKPSVTAKQEAISDILSEEALQKCENIKFTPLECALSEELQEFTYYLSAGYNIDFPYVMGLMFCESSFRTDCASKTNDYGLMQINEQNHEWLSRELALDDIEDPYQNIRAGLFVLHNLFEKYGDSSKVAMAYNMGEYNASLLWEKGVNETDYSRKVLAKADEYRTQLENSIKK